ncbi:ArsR/SmtB family transcription factor [Desulfolutivibrio sulfoxidireducens]|uniref:ArsR/SmtB family transcription factor n=1 Tax=Desulfolutivibrio sulfoxidireducens TaxID=2773299 RepID=UPI00159EA55F|nr:metalloregulator ArsR/SmtB family transcription factor [Desulfolutivibrio sulfoxidireducens]QLA18591.1 metalloregulator ArsR/SmtB family transcription factor [Desulfolutivibrio sulfoxidireducens]
MLKQIEPKQGGGADVARLARIFRVLCVDTRVRMVALLSGRPMCVGALARSLGITAAAVSQHLRVLRDAGAVVADKRGNFVHYRADRDVLAAWGREMAGFFGGVGGRDRGTDSPVDAAEGTESGAADREGEL